MPEFIHSFFEAQTQLFPRQGVWQHVPPSDYRDRMADEGAPATPPGGYPLSNHGGSTIPAPKLALVYLGPWWGDTAKIEAFAGDLMTAGYLAPLKDYGSGNGTYIGAFKGPTVTGTVQDADLRKILSGLINQNKVPAPDGHTLYALLLPDNVTVDQGGSASCQAFCGYHDALDAKTFYSVQTASDCQGCNMGDPFAAFCAVLAHEVAEACTDAVPGQGWYNDATGQENADEWAWTFGPYGPWTVQGYQVNGVGNSLSIIKYQPQQPAPQPQPGPQNCQATVDATYTADDATFNAVVAGDHRNPNTTMVALGNVYRYVQAWRTYDHQMLDAATANTALTVALPEPPGEAV